VFTSDRENQSNLFRYDLDTGLITQMTDLHGSGRPGGCVSAANNALYFGWQGTIRELDLDTYEERVLWEQTAPMLIRGRANPTADGKYVYVMLMEDQPEEKPAISFSYSRFREFFRLKPLTQSARIEIESGEKVWRRNGHTMYFMFECTPQENRECIDKGLCFDRNCSGMANF
jgi:hypothetical protein